MINKQMLLLLVVGLLAILLGCTNAERKKDAPLMGGFIRSLIGQDNTLFICENGNIYRLNLSNRVILNDSAPCEQFYQDKIGRILSVTKYRILIYDGTRWQEVNVLQEGPVNYVSETNDGLIWVSSSLLSYHDLKTGRPSVVVPSVTLPAAAPTLVPGEWVVSAPSKGYLGPVYEASDGMLWYNQQFDGIVRWDRRSGQKQLWGPKSDFQNSVPLPTKFLQTRDHDIWVGMETGVYRFHNGAWQTWTLPGEGSRSIRNQGDYRVIDLLEDHNDNVWTVFNRAGVAMWNGSSWNAVDNFEFPATPLAVFETSTGEIWIGVLHHGVTKYQNGILTELSKNNVHLYYVKNARK